VLTTEFASENTDSAIVSAPGAAAELQRVCTEANHDPDLWAVIVAWSTLPAAVKESIVTMVTTVQSRSSD